MTVKRYKKFKKIFMLNIAITLIFLNFTFPQSRVFAVYDENPVLTTDTTAPELTSGTIKRISDSSATVTFTSNELGKYYYSIVEPTYAYNAPVIDTSGIGKDIAGINVETKIDITDLTEGGKDIYIVVKDAAGNVNKPIRMYIWRYSEPYSSPAKLTAISSQRVSTSKARITFKSNKSGTLHFVVVEYGDKVPIIDTSGRGMDISANVDRTIYIDGLSYLRKEVYIVVKNTSGNVSESLKMDIEECETSIKESLSNSKSENQKEQTMLFRIVPVMIKDKSISIEQLEMIRIKQKDFIIDVVNIDFEKMKDVVSKMKDISTNEITIRIPDALKDNENKIQVQIPKESTYLFGNNDVGLNIEAEEAKINLSKETMRALRFNDLNIDIAEVKNERKINVLKQILQKSANVSEIETKPIKIDSNFSSKAEIIISLDKEKILAQSNLKDYLNSLAVVVEHGNGENELIKGEIKYDLVGNPIGISINLDKLNGTFMVVSVNTPKLSNSCDIEKYISLSDFSINGNTASKIVKNEVTNERINVQVSPKANWKLYSDLTCINELKDKIMNLNTGTNIAYIRVTAEDGQTSKLYTININRESKQEETVKVDPPKKEEPKKEEPKKEESKKEEPKKDVAKIKTLMLIQKGNLANEYSGSVLAKKLGATMAFVGKTDKEVQSTIKSLTANLTSKDKIYIIGMDLAQSNKIKKILNDTGYNIITVIGNADKYETAKLIADNLNVIKGTPTVLINADKIPANSEDVKKICALIQYPILFVKNNQITRYTEMALKNINPTKIYVFGDNVQINETVIKELQKKLNIKSQNIQRISFIS